MALLTDQRRLEILECRRARHDGPWWHDQDRGDACNSGCGGMAVIAVVVLGVISSFIISFW